MGTTLSSYAHCFAFFQKKIKIARLLLWLFWQNNENIWNCRLFFQKYFALILVFVDIFPKNISLFWSQRPFFRFFFTPSHDFFLNIEKMQNFKLLVCITVVPWQLLFAFFSKIKINWSHALLCQTMLEIRFIHFFIAAHSFFARKWKNLKISMFYQKYTALILFF